MPYPVPPPTPPPIVKALPSQNAHQPADAASSEALTGKLKGQAVATAHSDVSASEPAGSEAVVVEASQKAIWSDQVRPTTPAQAASPEDAVEPPSVSVSSPSAPSLSAPSPSAQIGETLTQPSSGAPVVARSPQLEELAPELPDQPRSLVSNSPQSDSDTMPLAQPEPRLSDAQVVAYRRPPATHSAETRIREQAIVATQASALGDRASLSVVGWVPESAQRTPVYSFPDPNSSVRLSSQPPSLAPGLAQPTILEAPQDPLPVLSRFRPMSQARLVAQSRNPDGTLAPERQILEIPGQGAPLPESPAPGTTLPSPEAEDLPPDDAEATESNGATSSPQTQLSLGAVEVIELRADRQEIDTLQQVFFAEGTVELRFQDSLLTADRVQVNLQNRLVVAEGDVTLISGNQFLQGDRFEYNFVQVAGRVTGARGEIFLPTASDDLSVLPTDVSANTAANVPLTRTLPENQPQVPITGGPGIEFGVGRIPGQESGFGEVDGEIRRIRFEAESIEFTANGWVAQNVRLTNDPFSPPELELRSRRVVYTRLSPTRARVRARNPVLVFDQNLTLPTVQNQVTIDSRRRDRNPLGQLGIDDEFGGVYLERPFEILSTDRASFSVSPLLLLQRIVTDNDFNIFDPSSFGLLAEFDYDFGPATSLETRAIFESLELDEFSDRFQGTARLRQAVPTGLGIHQLTAEATYRNRLFNGSLGFQRVQSSLGLLFTSPIIPLGSSGISLSYQASAQLISAVTDDPDLLDPGQIEGLADLGRFQASAALSRAFPLWQGRALPRTPTEGMRYTPNPIVPYVTLVAGLRGTATAYTSGDTQNLLTGSLSLFGQFGNFSRDFLDYTGFNVTISQTLQEGESPFRFDRVVDRSVLSMGILQQIYGPFRFGVQTTLSLNRADTIDTDYILEYSRRTYAVTLRYNPIRESGAFGIRISDFNWGTRRGSFSGAATVEGGVQRSDD
ncbi:DUF3769 domain-containing protein [Leptolyngbya sp. AN02str]|uniref:DUF3769 domain-containing protein n=1 Tax=Leptolyngbya sp. AN02str TaxID=3423363 RepID=UPI003D32344B